MVDAWGGWSLFQTLLQTLKKVASKHGVSISTVAVKNILDQVITRFFLFTLVSCGDYDAFKYNCLSV